ncbi:MAG: right-handed parallel beta-helix repeat-containing protein, partial [Candidatus Cloacimonetes bacterium]|nr:right-handed parallel beta-helix repeat-containing protein [Candidatus Cloacimonadota bacterium]
MKSVFSVFVFFIISVFLSATIINIPGDQPTIQQGIDVAVNSDTVLVSPGTYVENINFNGKNIMVASWFLTTQDTTYITQTIIDGNQDGSVVTISSGEDSTAVLCGFKIINGNGGYGGGGIYCSYPATNPEISNNIIQNNSATRGGGIFITASPIVKNNIIQDNHVTVAGGGIVTYGGAATIRNNTFIGNISNTYGGGIHIENSGILTISGNSFINNFAQNIGGGACFYAEVSGGIFNNNLVVNNTSEQASAIFFFMGHYTLINNTITENNNNDFGLSFYEYSQAVLINNIIWNNADQEIFVSHDANVEVRYCDIQGGWEGEGNIDSDPLFVNPDEGDFHLQDTSPCIGAGIDEIEINGTWYYAPLFDIEGNPRPDPVGSMPDMGAYESFLGEPQVGIDDCQLTIVDFRLHNYPNPFNPETTITFNLTTEHTESTELIIYNIKGQKIKTL